MIIKSKIKNKMEPPNIRNPRRRFRSKKIRYESNINPERITSQSSICATKKLCSSHLWIARVKIQTYLDSRNIIRSLHMCKICHFQGLIAGFPHEKHIYSKYMSYILHIQLSKNLQLKSIFFMSEKYIRKNIFGIYVPMR